MEIRFLFKTRMKNWISLPFHDKKTNADNIKIVFLFQVERKLKWLAIHPSEANILILGRETETESPWSK